MLKNTKKYSTAPHPPPKKKYQWRDKASEGLHSSQNSTLWPFITFIVPSKKIIQKRKDPQLALLKIGWKSWSLRWWWWCGWWRWCWLLLQSFASVSSSRSQQGKGEVRFWLVGQNGVGILRCHSEEFDKGGIFGGDQALPRGGSVISRKRGEFWNFPAAARTTAAVLN